MLDDGGGQAGALLMLALIRLRQMGSDAAEGQFKEALALWPDKDIISTGWARLGLGMVCMARDEWTEARRELEQALTHFQESGDEQYLVTLDTLGTLQLHLHDIIGARSTYEAMLAASRSSESERHEARGLIGMGDTLRWLSNLDGARECYERAFHLARGIPDHDIEAGALGSLGALEIWTGDLGTSQVLHERALSLWQNPRAPTDHFGPLLGLASLRIARRQDASALIEQRSALLAGTQR